MNPAKLYLRPWRDYATFTGRATIPEFWMFTLVNTVLTVALFQLDIQLGLLFAGGGFGYISTAFMAAVFVPTIAVAVRRLHDSGLEGALIAASIIPIIGLIATVVMLLRSGQVGENRFGPDPRGRTVATLAADGGLPFATASGRMLVCPWCWRKNPAGVTTCQWCHKAFRLSGEGGSDPA